MQSLSRQSWYWRIRPGFSVRRRPIPQLVPTGQYTAIGDRSGFSRRIQHRHIGAATAVPPNARGQAVDLDVTLFNSKILRV